MNANTAESADHFNPESIPNPESIQVRRLDLGRIFGVPFMVLLLIANARPLFYRTDEFQWSFATVGEVTARVLTISFYALYVAVFVRRSPARATSPSRPAVVIAVLTTYLPLSIGLLHLGAPSLLMLIAANALLLMGLGFSLWSLRSLDRSFSIIPQARAVVRRGPYRFVRHPLYTGELTSVLGIALLNPGWATFVIWVGLCGLQAYRARHEEAILLATLPDYAEYHRQTPQLLPLSISRAWRNRTVSAD